jgi:hypothetical protein
MHAAPVTMAADSHMQGQLLAIRIALNLYSVHQWCRDAHCRLLVPQQMSRAVLKRRRLGTVYCSLTKG